MQVTLFLPVIHDKHLDQPKFHEKLRSAIIDAFTIECGDARFENQRTKQFPIQFRYRSDPQPKLLIEVEILSSGYIKDFYHGGVVVTTQKVFRERGIHEVIPGCELCLSITMKTSLVL